MKDFRRSHISFSLCGLNCALCPMHIDGYCPGCGGGAGNQSCAIARCSLQHDNVEYCFLCPEYPCQQYEDIEAYDSFITHQRQQKDMTRALEMGIKAYLAELIKKADILKKLLSDYNDGRRKTFFCVAVNLLPLQDLELIMEQITRNVTCKDLSRKEKAAQMVSYLQQRASQQGITLKLRKKR